MKKKTKVQHCAHAYIMDMEQKENQKENMTKIMDGECFSSANVKCVRQCDMLLVASVENDFTHKEL